MTKQYPVFSLIGAGHNFHVTINLFNSEKFNIKYRNLIVSNLTLATFLFLSVLHNSVGKLCRLSYSMYISLNSSEQFLNKIWNKCKKTLCYYHYEQLLPLLIRFIVPIKQLPYQNVVRVFILGMSW